MRYSVAVGALPFYPFGASLNLARHAGADGVELMVTPWLLRRGPTHYVELADRHATPILSAHALLRYSGASLPTQIVEDCASIAFAARIPSCVALVLHPPLTGPRQSPGLNRWLDAICEARALSGRPSLALAIENRPENRDGTPEQYLDDLERLRWLTEEWDIGVTFDVAHAASHGGDLARAIDTLRARLVNVHLSDAGTRAHHGGLRNGLFRDHRLPGNGNLPLDRVMAALTRAGYDGLVTLEPSPASLRAWWPLAARRLLREGMSNMRALAATVPAAPAAVEPRRPSR